MTDRGTGNLVFEWAAVVPLRLYSCVVVPARAFFIGRLGWVRLSALHCGLLVEGEDGGPLGRFMYSPTKSGYRARHALWTGAGYGIKCRADLFTSGVLDRQRRRVIRGISQRGARLGSDCRRSAAERSGLQISLSQVSLVLTGVAQGPGRVALKDDGSCTSRIDGREGDRGTRRERRWRGRVQRFRR
jgi:hypothetical protein